MVGNEVLEAKCKLWNYKITRFQLVYFKTDHLLSNIYQVS